MYTLQSINTGRFLNIYFENSKFDCYLIDKIGQTLIKDTNFSYMFRPENNDLAISDTSDFYNGYIDAYKIVEAIKL